MGSSESLTELNENSVDQQILSTTLQLGDRTIVVEATPLAKSPQTRLGVIVGQSRPEYLNLKGMRFLHFGPLRVPLLFVALLYVGQVLYPWPPRQLQQRLGAAVICAIGFAVIAVLDTLYGGTRAAKFDRSTRKARFRDDIWRRRKPTKPILAVQLLPGRVDEDVRQAWPGLQLNLVVDDPQQPRVGFITFRDADWTREAGRKLANHLGVPLVDQIPRD